MTRYAQIPLFAMLCAALLLCALRCPAQDARSVAVVVSGLDESCLVQDRALFELDQARKAGLLDLPVTVRRYDDAAERARCNRAGIYGNALPLLAVVEGSPGGEMAVQWRTGAGDPAAAVGALVERLRPGCALPGRTSEVTSMGVNASGFEELLNEKDGSVLIRIPRGEFPMGSPDGVGAADERPLHTVRLDGYLIGKYEVTNGQFAHFVAETGYKAVGRWKKYAPPGRARHPVTDLTWSDAAAYCRWASARLPTEAEWERAARGIDGRRFPWGSSWDRNLCNNWTMDRREFVSLLADIEDYRGTMPSGMIAGGASPCGARDMSGNAVEWCADWYDAGYYGRSPAENPLNGEKSFSHVWRGGSWVCGTLELFRCASRGRLTPVNRFYSSGSGLRLCRTATP